MTKDIRNIEEKDIPSIVSIDRSDDSPVVYRMMDGVLAETDAGFRHPGLKPEQYRPYADELRKVLREGGEVFGAYRDGRMIGIASIDGEPVGTRRDRLNLGLLWVDRSFRRRGVAAELLAAAKEAVRRRGFNRLYISATPSGNTVDFYLTMGAKPTEDVDPVLFAKEPEDIHLELDCSR